MSENIGLPVVNKEGLYYFCPLLGDGTFGSLCVADITYKKGKHHVYTVRSASHAEHCRLCDAHEQYMFWYILLTISKNQGDSGMLMQCQRYKNGIIGIKLPYPKEETSTADGSHV